MKPFEWTDLSKLFWALFPCRQVIVNSALTGSKEHVLAKKDRVFYFVCEEKRFAWRIVSLMPGRECHQASQASPQFQPVTSGSLLTVKQNHISKRVSSKQAAAFFPSNHLGTLGVLEILGKWIVGNAMTYLKSWGLNLGSENFWSGRSNGCNWEWVGAGISCVLDTVLADGKEFHLERKDASEERTNLIFSNSRFTNKHKELWV